MAIAWRRNGAPWVGGAGVTLGVLLASYPAASYSGYESFATDLGANGTYVRSNGTRWLPVGGETTLTSLGAPVSGITSVEQLPLQYQLPINAWQTNDTLRIFLTMTKSGTTDSGLISIRVGTLGTASDTLITGTGGGMMGVAQQSAGFIFDIRLESATSARKVGGAANSVGTYTGVSTTTAAAATTITSASANSLWISAGLASSAASNTVAIQSGQIKLLTP